MAEIFRTDSLAISPSFPVAITFPPSSPPIGPSSITQSEFFNTSKDGESILKHCQITGATLFLIPEQKFIFPATLLDYINENKINLIFWVPSVLVNIANLKLFNSIKIPTIKKVFLV